MLRNITAVLALACAATPLAAQNSAPVVNHLPASTRALGMADAFPVGGSDSDAIFYNPALAQNISGITLSGQRWGAAATLLAASGAAEWWGGRVAIGILSLDYDVGLGRGAGDFAEEVLLGSGPVQFSERAAAVAYARRIKGIRLAATGKVIEVRREAERETLPALDLSAGHVIGFVAAGLAVQNLGPAADDGVVTADSPIRVTLNAATTRASPVGPLDVLPALSLSRLPDGTFVPAAGVEVGYWPIQGRTFIARLGIREPPGDDQKPFTLGAGFMGDRIALDWAWAGFDDGSTHRLSVRWR